MKKDTKIDHKSDLSNFLECVQCHGWYSNIVDIKEKYCRLCGAFIPRRFSTVPAKSLPRVFNVRTAVRTLGN